MLSAASGSDAGHVRIELTRSGFGDHRRHQLARALRGTPEAPPLLIGATPQLLISRHDRTVTRLHGAAGAWKPWVGHP